MRADRTRKKLISLLTGPTGGWKRQSAVLFSAVAVAGGIALAEGKPETRGLKPQPIAIEARALAGFDKERKDATRFGRLEWRGGAVLTSASSLFGGWSGLTIDAGGRRVIAVSDAGTWLTGELAYNGQQLSGVTAARIGPVLGIDKKPLAKSRDRDAEGVVLIDGSSQKGNVLISFEGNDRIGRFASDGTGIGAPSGYLNLPLELKKVRSFDGIEAVAILRGGALKGSFVALAEHLLPKQVDHAGWIWTGGGEPKRFSLTDIGGFDITDAAGLPDGSLVVLERRFRWTEGVKMRMRQIKAADLKPGAVVTGEILIEADLNQEIDNMEGLAVHSGPQGETILTLISDDNFNSLLQRTVLLQFALPARSVAAR